MNETADEGGELDLDAGEFVLGTLSPTERMRFEMRLRTDRRAQAAVAYWERRLAPLAGFAADIEPTPALFPRIEQTIKLQGRQSRGRAMVPLYRRIWNNLSLWRSAAIGAGLLAAAFAGLLLIRPFPQAAVPSFVAILGNAEGGPVWLVTTDSVDGTVSVDPVDQLPTDNRVPELWLIPAGASAPISLGVLQPGARTVTRLGVEQLEKFGRGASLAVSLEPPGGSPIGTPTGPIVQQGRVVAYQP
jgi:anti-sigma-K factor RskA